MNYMKELFEALPIAGKILLGGNVILGGVIFFLFKEIRRKERFLLAQLAKINEIRVSELKDYLGLTLKVSERQTMLSETLRNLPTFIENAIRKAITKE